MAIAEDDPRNPFEPLTEPVNKALAQAGEEIRLLFSDAVGKPNASTPQIHNLLCR